MALNFTVYDYNSTVERMTELLKDKPGWGQGYESSTGQTLIQLMADVNDHLLYMLERRSQEAYMVTARLASSVRARASGIGYRPRRKVSATGTLELVLVDDDEVAVAAIGDVTLQSGTRITFDGAEFVSTEDVMIPAGSSSVMVPIKQGIQRQETFDFSEEPYVSNPTILFSDDYVSKEEYSLVVGSTTENYTDVNDIVDNRRLGALSFASADMAVYDIKYKTDGMRLVFGDGIFGKQPTGDITVSWIESDGDEVSVVKTGLDFKLDASFLTDNTNTLPQNQYKYTLRNTTPVRGGKAEETIEEIRNNAPQYLKTNNRAVTNDDFEFWTMRSGIGNIIDCSAYGEHETGMLIFSMNNVYISYVTSDGLPLNPEQISQLNEYLNMYKGATTHIVFKNANRVALQIQTHFKRHPSLPISDTQLYRILYESINEYLSVTRDSIGKEFQHSEFVEYIQNLTTNFNGITYPMTDFVKVDVSAMYPFAIPQESYDGIIRLSYDYTLTTNDVWSITVDGNVYSVVVAYDDTIESLVQKMRTEIFNNTSYMLASPNPNEIRIKHPEESGVFSVSVGTGNLAPYTTFETLIQVPKPTYTSNINAQLIKPGSVEIVDINEVVHMVDNGEGSLVAAGNYTYPSVTFDYNLCLLDAPSLPNGQYYVRYQQNDYQNFVVPRDGVITLMPIREEGNTDESTHFFSTITLVS